MSKINPLVKYFKKINTSINNLLEKNLNKLNFNNLVNLTQNNKIVLTFVAVIVLFISYLSLPNFYTQNQLSIKLKSELLNKLNLNFYFSGNLEYNFFPKPHFVSKNVKIKDELKEISNIKKIKIYISTKKMLSLENIKIEDIIIEDANFNLNQKNYDFFVKLLDNKFLENILKIKNSNIFFRNSENEVLFINKILEMKYFYDENELKNIVYSGNEIFNIPYSIKLFKNKNDKKIFSILNLSFLKLKIINEFSFNELENKGKSELVYDKSKTIAKYVFNKKFFNFEYFDKFENPKFLYKGNFNLVPFYSSITGRTKELNLSILFDSNSIIAHLLKTELFNNKNIDFKLNIGAKNILNNLNFIDLNLNSKIQEGLIDIDNTKFKWKNFSSFKISESLIFVKNGELFLDGKLIIDVKNYEEIFKYLLTPKNYRKEFKKIELNFSYNFDQKTINLNNIKIDNRFNKSINKIMSSILLKENNLKNKIYLKKILNNAIKIYAG